VNSYLIKKELLVVSEICKELHHLFNQLKRHRFSFDEVELPKNGIYVLFEKGELAHEGDRIVRVGTHTGNNQLRSRLQQHFINENKDRSIFRKNVGRALLNKNNDDYLKIWEIDMTTRKAKEKFGHLINLSYQCQIEKEVSMIIQNHFSFAVMEVNNKDNRLLYEAKLISEISNCEVCQPSLDWLGNYSTKEKIRDSGLWQVNELHKNGLTAAEFTDIQQIFNI
jgi:hypothetical protein